VQAGGNNVSIYGQEVDELTLKIAIMNLAMNGLDGDLRKSNTFHNDLHFTLKADFIISHPPFNFAKFGYLQDMMDHLAPDGKMGIVLTNNSLSSRIGNDSEVRKNIVENDILECIVAMPTHLFYTMQIPVCLWFLNRNKKQKGKTLFVDARGMGKMVDRRLHELSKGDVRRIATAVQAFRDEKNFCVVVSTKEIAKQNYILNPWLYTKS